MKCLCPADLTHRLSVQKNTPTVNADGQPVESWKETGKIWAKLTSRGGMERRVFEQLRAVCDYVAQFQWSKSGRDITPADHRFVDVEDGKILNIADVFDPDGTKNQLHAHCTEVVV